MRYAHILGTGSYLPEKVLTNADLEKMVDTTDQWIVERTGVHKRHIRDTKDTTVSMGVAAAKNALEAANIDKNKIGLIIVATTTPDRLFPNTASLVQFHLGLHTTACPAFDISVACSGFIYALSIADQYIRAGSADYVLVVASESMTRLVDWQDRSTCVLFGDGAGAVILGMDEKPGICSTHLHTDGSLSELLTVSGDLYAGNQSKQTTQNDIPAKAENKPCYIKMRGNETFKVAVTKLGEVVEEALAYNKLDKSAIDWLIPHQANLRIIQATAKKLNLPMERVIVTVGEHGNTSAASVALALDMGIRDGLIKRGDLMLLEAFSAGLAWGAALVRY